jgi:hypothetical protein
MTFLTSSAILGLFIGKESPKAAGRSLVQALQRVEVTLQEHGPSGFQIEFLAVTNERGYSSLLSNPLLELLNRVILTITLNVSPRVLMDGIITYREVKPGNEKGSFNLVLTGEDVGIMMDRDEVPKGYPAQDDAAVAREIISKYSKYGLKADITPPKDTHTPSTNDPVPMQQQTDLGYLKELAKRYGYIFYIVPGPSKGENTAYWGPPKREGRSQPAISVNMGPFTNVESIRFSSNPLAIKVIEGSIQDRDDNQVIQIPPLNAPSLKLAKQSLDPLQARHIRFRGSGLKASWVTSMAKAQGEASFQNLLTATGVLDAFRYGDILQPHYLVDLRGAGPGYDGKWQVSHVTHLIQRGEYKQRFTLARDGTGSTVQKVAP